MLSGEVKTRMLERFIFKLRTMLADVEKAGRCAQWRYHRSDIDHVEELLR
jgi:hypothetical protein